MPRKKKDIIFSSEGTDIEIFKRDFSGIEKKVIKSIFDWDQYTEWPTQR